MTPNTNITPNEEIRLEEGSHVELHFEVSLPNGVVIDSTFNRPEPVALTIGDDSLLGGFEKVLMGLKAGDTRTAHLPATDAFGEWQQDNVQHFSPSQFALISDDLPSVGAMIEFNDKGNNSLVGVVSAVNDKQISVDFNHPLAGQDVLFKVAIFKVTPKGQMGISLS